MRVTRTINSTDYPYIFEHKKPYICRSLTWSNSHYLKQPEVHWSTTEYPVLIDKLKQICHYVRRLVKNHQRNHQNFICNHDLPSVAFERVMTLHLNKLGSQNLIYFLCTISPPLRKKTLPAFEQTTIIFSQGCFIFYLVWL